MSRRSSPSSAWRSCGFRDAVPGTRSIALAALACYLVAALTAEPFSVLQASGVTVVIVGAVIGPGLAHRA